MSAFRRSLLLLAVVLGLVAVSLVVIALRPTVLGLDLQGGVEVVLQGSPTPEAEVNAEALDRSIEVIRGRVDAFGVAEPEIQRQDPDQIIVALPGVQGADQEQVVRDLVRPAQLIFYHFDESGISGETPREPQAFDRLFDAVEEAQDIRRQSDRGADRFYLFGSAPERSLLLGPETDRDTFDERVADRFPNGLPGGAVERTLPAGFVTIFEEQPIGTGGATVTRYFLLHDEPRAFGADITRAVVAIDSSGIGDPNPVVNLSFSDKGEDDFGDLTRDVAQASLLNQSAERFSAVLDGEIVSNVTVDPNRFPNGLRSGGSIEGNFSQSEAQRLASQLNSGAIPIELNEISVKSVSATLGKQSLQQGLTAGLVGLALVVLFLIGYYRVLGVIAALALLIYAAMLFAVIELVPVTLTLPGIAGIILTIGIASDANVVIFERVREESRAGQAPRVAILNGYKKGISAIIDANVVTLATAAILFLFATAGVKGFAFTLFVGVLLSFFTAVVGTRAIFGVVADTKLLRDDRFMGLGMKQPGWEMDWVGRWKMWLAISFIPIIIGMGWIGVNGLNLGLDFESGTRLTIQFEEQPSEDEVRQVFSDLGYSAKVQSTTVASEGGGPAETGYQITTETLQTDARAQVTAALEERFGQSATDEFTLVGPTFGRQVIEKAITAIILSFIAMAVYLSVRFEYKLALPALLSVVQDVLLSVSIYAFTGREVTAATVAALLTVLGYSLYDVVIVFDRIRENVPILRGRPYRDVVNRSIREVLSRSLITTFTTLVPIIALYFFGGDTLKDFAFALGVGIFSGGASSIVISAPLAALWKEREGAAKAKPTAEEKRRALVAAGGDSDIVDEDALARAELALSADDGRDPDAVAGLLGEGEEAPEPGAGGGDPSEPDAGAPAESTDPPRIPDGDAADGDPDDAPPKRRARGGGSGHPRRHTRVRRNKR